MLTMHCDPLHLWFKCDLPDLYLTLSTFALHTCSDYLENDTYMTLRYSDLPEYKMIRELVRPQYNEKFEMFEGMDNKVCG